MFIPTRPEKFNSLREEFIYDLNMALDAEMAKKWPDWNKYQRSQFF